MELDYNKPYKHTAPPKYTPPIPKENMMPGAEALDLGGEIDEELEMEANPQDYLENFHTKKPYQKVIEIRTSSYANEVNPMVDQALAKLSQVAKLVEQTEKNQRMVQLLKSELEKFKINA